MAPDGFFYMKIPKGKPGGRLWDWDPERGIAQYWHWDAQNSVGIIETVQDVTPIQERNKAIKAEEFELSGSKDLRYLGSLPMTVLMDMIKKGQMSEGPLHLAKDESAVRQKLNDPDYSDFRATHKKV